MNKNETKKNNKLFENKEYVTDDAVCCLVVSYDALTVRTLIVSSEK